MRYPRSTALAGVALFGLSALLGLEHDEHFHGRRAEGQRADEPAGEKRRRPTCCSTPHNPGRQVSLGAGGVREGRRRRTSRSSCRSAAISLDYWCHVCMERESFHGRRDRQGTQRGFHRHQGRPRGAAGRRPGLHDGRAGDQRVGRMADVDVPDARRPAVLRRDVLPPRRIRLPAQGRRRRLARPAAGGREGREHALRRRQARLGRPGPAGRCPAHERAGPRGAGRPVQPVRPRVRRLRLRSLRVPGGRSSPSRRTCST